MRNELIVSNLNEMTAMLQSIGDVVDPLHRMFIDLMRGLPHGCSCNRKQRHQQAIDLYHAIPQSLTDFAKSMIKQTCRVDYVKIRFNDELLYEF